MTPETWQRVERVLDAALAVEPAEWPAVLDRMCAGDAAVRREVESLLARHARARTFLEAPAAEVFDDIGPDAPGPPLEGRRIGPYRILREVGHGGMGRVFLAERDDGEFEQRVALKLLRPGFHDPAAERRFRTERQILAGLNHPNIARLLDGGVTDDGEPYLVMEYVEGQPIDAFFDARRLTLAERLDLFAVVCDAVQYAHRALVVHRDLKPSNILVTADGRVKLVDFGIAMLLDGGAAAAHGGPASTGFRIMTPEYASPEQIRGNPLTTASDIFSLGVVLYELLSGSPPYRMSRRSPHELARLICEHEPPRPSARLGKTGHATGDDVADRSSGCLAEIGSARATSVDRLRRSLRGDLDAIVLKALRKEPERRYESAEALAADIRRHRTGLPVLARRGSRGYRARKFLRRRWLETAAAAAVALALLLGSALAAWQAASARRERDRAEAALDRSEEVTGFLLGLFESSDPVASLGDTVAARELLHRGVRQADALAGQPLLQARLLHVLGRIYLSLGRTDAAEPLLRRALELRRDRLGPEDPEVAESLVALGTLQYRKAHWREAERSFRQALEIQRRALGPEHPAVASTLIDVSRVVVLYDLEQAVRLRREAVGIQRKALGRSHPDLARAANILAAALRARGEREEAEALYRETIANHTGPAGSADTVAASTMYHLADLLRERNHRLDEAETLYRRGLELQRRQLGHDHPALLHGLHALGVLRGARGDSDEGEALLRDALALNRRIYGASSRQAAHTTGLLADHVARAGRLEQAESIARESLGLWERSVGRDHTGTAGVMTSLARILTRQQRFAEAEALYREALSIRERALGSDAGPTGATWLMLADLLWRRGDAAAAEPAFRRALEILRGHYGEDHVNTRAAYAGLAALAEAAGRADEARSYRRLAGTDPQPDWLLPPEPGR